MPGGVVILNFLSRNIHKYPSVVFNAFYLHEGDKAVIREETVAVEESAKLGVSDHWYYTSPRQFTLLIKTL